MVEAYGVLAAAAHWLVGWLCSSLASRRLLWLGPKPMVEEVNTKSPDVSAPIHQLSLGSRGLYCARAYFDQQGLPRGLELFTPILPIVGVSPRNFPMILHLQQAIPFPVMALDLEQASKSYGSYGDVTVLSGPVAVRRAKNILVLGSPSVTGPPVGMSAHMGFPYPMRGLALEFSKTLSGSKVMKPTACPAKMDKGSEMAKLTLGPSPSAESSNLTMKILEQHPTTSSAFQLKGPFNKNNLGPSPNTISVV